LKYFQAQNNPAKSYTFLFIRYTSTIIGPDVDENSTTASNLRTECVHVVHTYTRDNIICLGFLRQNYGYVNPECHIIGRCSAAGRSSHTVCRASVGQHAQSDVIISPHTHTLPMRWCVCICVGAAVFLSSGWCKKGMICLIPTATRRTKNYFRINREASNSAARAKQNKKVCKIIASRCANNVVVSAAVKICSFARAPLFFQRGLYF